MKYEVLFEGKKHKITTDGEAFFLYAKTEEDKWELRDKNSMDSEIYEEALEDIKKILSADMEEEEKILRICESGFFDICNL